LPLLYTTLSYTTFYYWLLIKWLPLRFLHVMYITIIKLTIKLRVRNIVLYLVNLLQPLNQKNRVGLSGVVDTVLLTVFDVDIGYTSMTYSVMV
jgi:hypothetical protein